MIYFCYSRFENIGQDVKIEDLITRPELSFEISFKNVTNGISLSGDFSCPECRDQVDTSTIEIQIVDSSNVTLNSLTVDGSIVEFRLKMRSGPSLGVFDSFFSELSSSSIEIFNVPRIGIVHSEFHNVTRGAIVVNAGVKVLSVEDSLMDKDILVRHRFTYLTELIAYCFLLVIKTFRTE